MRPQNVCLWMLLVLSVVHGFVSNNREGQHLWGISSRRERCVLANAANADLRPVSPDSEGIPVAFIEVDQQNFIECYVDSIATVGGVEYTIGVPCDYAVAICYLDEEDQLIPVELDDPKMSDVFPVAERIIEEEFGEELVLQQTPQTLTLMGELEEEDDEFDEDEDDDDVEDGEEEVEVLLAFEHRDTHYNLVRLLDPILIVGKESMENPQCRVLLDAEESEKIMATLEDLFLKYRPDDTEGLTD